MKSHYTAETVLELMATKRKSFYGKAKVIVAKGEFVRFLVSYDTVCCAVDSDGKVHRFDHRDSYTTRCHLKEFLRYGYEGYWDLPIEEKPSITVEL